MHTSEGLPETFFQMSQMTPVYFNICTWSLASAFISSCSVSSSSAKNSWGQFDESRVNVMSNLCGNLDQFSAGKIGDFFLALIHNFINYVAVF
jgi:hypothetical protein